MQFPEPVIQSLPDKILVGMSLDMSVAEDKTGLLWGSFMPHRKTIKNASSEDLYSLQLYPAGYFDRFDPTAVFTKWAAAEVQTAMHVPNGMEVLKLPGGKYAVFQYKGMPGNPAIFQYIYGEWIDGSGFELDERPHFELLGHNYRPGSPDSEEELWIPIR